MAAEKAKIKKGEAIRLNVLKYRTVKDSQTPNEIDENDENEMLAGVQNTTQTRRSQSKFINQVNAPWVLRHITQPGGVRHPLVALNWT